MRVGSERSRSLDRILRNSREGYYPKREHGVGGLGTRAAKNFSKLGQFLPKRQDNT